jgi:hypothetical protein
MPKHFPYVLVILHLSTIGIASSNLSAMLRKNILLSTLCLTALDREEAVLPKLQKVSDRDGQESADGATSSQLTVLDGLAKDALVEDKHFLGKRRFEVSLIKKTYWYDLDPVPLSDVLSADDRYSMPLEALIRIEAVKSDLQESVPTERFWPGPVSAAEAIIQDCVKQLQNSSMKSRTSDIQQRSTEMIEDQLKLLKTGIESYAARQGLQRIDVQARDPVVGYRVQIKVEPNKAHVHVMTLLLYKKYESLGTPPDKYEWTDLMESETLLIGRYRYRVDWPQELNGPEEGSIEITEPGILTFTPKSH